MRKLWKSFNKKPLYSRIRFIICMIMILITMITVVVGSMSMDTYSNQYDNNTKEITKLKTELSKIKATDDEPVEDIKQNLSSCEKIGKKIADCQNRYQHTKDNAYVAISQELSLYFSEDSANARTQWFMNTNAGDYEWEFETNYLFSSSSVPVLWVCKSKDDDSKILAYTTGEYDASTNLFSSISVETTAIGSNDIPAS